MPMCKLESTLPGDISITSAMQTDTTMAESRENWLLDEVKDKVKKLA